MVCGFAALYGRGAGTRFSNPYEWRGKQAGEEEEEEEEEEEDFRPLEFVVPAITTLPSTRYMYSTPVGFVETQAETASLSSLAWRLSR